ncbi:MAG: HU family DNA-binding protein [Actinomycetota bacterium]
MNRRELVTAVAAHSGTDAKVVDGVLRGFTDVVLATVAKGDPVVLTGFAKFAKVQTKARMGRNPATGEAIKIKASKKARITPLKGFKDVVLGAAPAPKLAKAAPAKAAPAKAAPAKAAPVRATKATTKAAPAKATKAAPRKAAAPAKAPARKSPARAAAKR